jgi:hypothetical protein
MILKSDIHSFSGLQQMPNKAVLNTDAPLVTRHIPWDSVQHAMIFRDSVLQQAVSGWTAAVCCCLPALGRSTLPRVVWRAVSVYVTTEQQKVSEHTQMLCSTLLLWTHTYLLQMCNTKSDETGITNRCGRYQLWLTCRYHPSMDRQDAAETIWHLIHPMFYGYCVA